jgi:hypothetical protein
MMIALLPIALLAACGSTERIKHAQPLAERVALILTADRSTYYVGEPIQLTSTFRNESGAPVRANFAVGPACGFSEMRYRKKTGAFKPVRVAVPSDVASHPSGMRLHAYNFDVVSPSVLAMNESRSTETRLALDGARLLFDEPGEYEFQLAYRDVPDDPNAALVSNTLAIHVAAPTAQDASAFDDYSRDGLANFAEFDPLRMATDATAIKKAQAFLDKHPSSVYAEPVREGLRRALRERVVRDRASKSERELHEKLEQERPPAQ